ncbi:MAG: plasmid mobilization relaxosome protein MobC [Alphaproteobacteria bacterium]|nr:plasmid mobilization relaxosome protein MobC [Alphaproteobacteria bacterium]MBO6629531.1 plasmid mobilization relaxosome protein MobC [Alphaproteobacteria bacterium]MDF1625794.1 plasmid mobilization relaxosome protein MobC [Parvibaculaceae bacterium]
MPRRGFRKPEPDRRHRLVKSYFTADEHRALFARAEATGLTLAAYVRACCLGEHPKAKPTRVAAETIRQLAAVGNNLNQLTRHANAGNLPNGQEVRQVLDQVIAAIVRLGGADDEEATS